MADFQVQGDFSSSSVAQSPIVQLSMSRSSVSLQQNGNVNRKSKTEVEYNPNRVSLLEVDAASL